MRELWMPQIPIVLGSLLLYFHQNVFNNTIPSNFNQCAHFVFNEVHWKRLFHFWIGSKQFRNFVTHVSKNDSPGIDFAIAVHHNQEIYRIIFRDTIRKYVHNLLFHRIWQNDETKKNNNVPMFQMHQFLKCSLMNSRL
jgi:hypothetical protein